MDQKIPTTESNANLNPDLTAEQRNRVEALAEEYADRKRTGESVDIEYYTAKHPELASEIRDLFPMMDILDCAVHAVPNSSHKHFDEIGAGTQLGEYRLIKPLGRGGMGVVYQAEHVVLGSSAAVKLLPAGLDRPKLRERFQREASAAARMRHPNIVRVFDFGVHGETLYYVMELVEGCGLNQIIDLPQAVNKKTDLPVVLTPTNAGENPSAASAASEIQTGPKTIFDNDQTAVFVSTSSVGAHQTDCDFASSNSESGIDRSKFSTSGSSHDSLWGWVARIGIQAADALDYAHAAGVVHRDIKPANVMIDADEKIHVMDFGLAKVADDQSLTAAGDVLGTLRYMPPESFSGRSDHRSDIYSLGLTLYELLVNQPAFEQVDRGQLIPAITHGQITRLRKILSKIPRDLETVIHKAISTEPGQRYQSAADFRADLKRYVSGQPVKARRTTIIYHATKWIVRNRVVSVLAASVLALSAIAAVVSAISNNRLAFAELQQELADERQQSAERITNVFDRFLRSYDASYQARENISVDDLLADAGNLLDTEFERDPLVEAKLRITVGNAYLWSTKTDTIVEGEAHLKRAVDLFKRHGGQPAELARALTGLARARAYAATPGEGNPLGLRTDFDSTLKLLEEALELHESIGEPSLNWAETLGVLAKVELERLNHVGLVEKLQHGLEMIEGNQSLEAKRLRPMLIGKLASCAYFHGNNQKAEQLFGQALDLSKELDNFNVKMFASGLGEAQLINGRFREGEATLREYVAAEPFVFSPKITMAIALQGDWQRAIEFSSQSLLKYERSPWESLVARRLHAQYLRLSGDDQQARALLWGVSQAMEKIKDHASPQHNVDYIKVNYYLARVLLFSEDQESRAIAIEQLRSLRGKLDPTSESSTVTIQLGYAIAISQFTDVTEADLELAEECIRLVEQTYTEFDLKVDSLLPRGLRNLRLELRFAKALLDDAKGERSSAISRLVELIAVARGDDILPIATAYREPVVLCPTLRIAEDLLVKWLVEVNRTDEAIEVLQQAVQSRKTSKYPAQHQINFARARLGRLLLQLDRKAEAREVLSKLAAETKDGPECFRWLEKRVASDLALAGK